MNKLFSDKYKILFFISLLLPFKLKENLNFLLLFSFLKFLKMNDTVSKEHTSNFAYYET